MTAFEIGPNDAGRVGKLHGLRLGNLCEAMWFEWREDALQRFAEVKA
jgi:hypothetical protein